jgi:hypothetical protein
MGVLEDHGDAAPMGTFQPRQDAQQHALARPVGAYDQGDRLACQGQIDPGQDLSAIGRELESVESNGEHVRPESAT